MNTEIRIREYCMRINIQSLYDFVITYFYENEKEEIKPIYNETKKTYDVVRCCLKITKPTFITLNDTIYELNAYPPNKYIHAYDVYVLTIKNKNIEKLNLESEIGDYDIIYRFKIDNDILNDINKT